MTVRWHHALIGALAMSGAVQSSGPARPSNRGDELVLSESLGGTFRGQRFLWSARESMRSAGALGSDAREGKACIVLTSTRAGYSKAMLHLALPDGALDFADCKWLSLFVRTRDVSRMSIEVVGRRPVKGPIDCFHMPVPVPRTAGWQRVVVPLRRGSLGLYQINALAKKGTGPKDLRPADFQAVCRVLSRIDIHFYGPAGSQVHIDGLHFSKQDVSKMKQLGEHIAVGPGLRIVDMDRLLDEGKLQLTHARGRPCLRTCMSSPTFEVALDAGKPGPAELLAVVLDVYDQGERNKVVRLTVDTVPKRPRTPLATFWLNNQEGATVHFAQAVWRRRVVFIDPAVFGKRKGGQARLRVSCDRDFSIAPLTCRAVDKARGDRWQQTWADQVEAFSRQHSETVVGLAMWDDDLRLYERGAGYRGLGKTVGPLRAKLDAAHAQCEAIERAIDRFYYESPASFVDGKESVGQKLATEFRQLTKQIGAAIERGRRDVQTAAHKAGFNIAYKCGLREFDKMKGSGRPILDRVPFYMFANARWNRPGVHAWAEMLYDVMKLYGIEGRFWCGSTLASSLRLLNDDRTHGWATVPCMMLLHYGLNHRMPKALHAQHGDELLAQTPHGPAKIWAQFQGNIFHPAYLQYTREFCAEAATRFAREPSVHAIGIADESQFMAMSPKTGGGLSAGYGKLGKQAWHAWLRAKHGDIATLNRRWGTVYKAFDEIPQPPGHRVKRDRARTGIIYDFETFRKESFADYIGMIHKTVKGAAPGKLTWTDPWGTMNNEVSRGLDYLKLSAHADIVHTHAHPTGHTMAYNYMLRRYLGKTLADAEFAHNREEGYADNPFGVVYAAVLRNFWVSLAWDTRALNVWPGAFYAKRTRAYEARRHDNQYVLPIRPGGAVRIMREKARHVRSVLFETTIVPTGAAIMQPSATLIMDPMAPYPDWVCTAEAMAVHAMLYNRGVSCLYVDEDRIADGRDDLADFSALILPHATYLADGVEQKLLAWVTSGGTLIAVGPCGLYNQYGQPSRKLLQAILGEVDVKLVGKDVAIEDATENAGTGGFKLPLPRRWPPVKSWAGWQYAIGLKGKPRDGVHVLSRTGAGAGIVEASYGHGRFVLSAFSLGKVPPDEQAKVSVAEHARVGHPSPFGEFLQSRVRAAIERRHTCMPVRLVRGSDVGLLVRQDAKGTRYVVAINHNTRRPVEATIEVGGALATVSDLCVGAGVPVPAKVKANRTRFGTLLAPGEGTVFRLQE